MPFRQSPEEQEDAAITRLVDDRAVESDQPEIRRQRRVADQLRTGGPTPPDQLVASIEAKVNTAYGPGKAKQRPRRTWLAVAGVAGAAAVCAAIVLAVVGIGGGGPSIPKAANLAFASPTGPAPAPKSATYLDASYGGVTFPNYQKFATPPTGTRTDSIGGRSALTVYYRLPDGTPLSYTVFSGKPVPRPSSAKQVVYQGVPLHLFTTKSGLSVVTLVRYGRTCVLAAKTKPSTVLGLAAAPVLAQPKA